MDLWSVLQRLVCGDGKKTQTSLDRNCGRYGKSWWDTLRDYLPL